MNKNEIKKELYRTKAPATFSYYAHGKLYYTVTVSGDTYQFPVATVHTQSVPAFEIGEEGYPYPTYKPQLSLATDVGTSKFEGIMEGRHLNRWIDKAIDSDDFIKL